MASNGTLYYVILHEMGHVLGIGSMWNLDGLKNGPFQFDGQNALNAYRQLSGNPSASFVPLETGGGPGTEGVHWSEAVSGNGLMTGYIAGIPDPLSIVTVGALKDMGYTVSTAADPYTLPGHLMADAQSSSLSADSSGGTLSLASPTASVLVSDTVGNGGSGAGDLALFTNYLASTFVPSPGQGTGGIAAMPAVDEQLLAHPTA